MNVAIYARKSRISNKGESIANQVELCKKYFLNMTEDKVDFLIYIDEGWSSYHVQITIRANQSFIPGQLY